MTASCGEKDMAMNGRSGVVFWGLVFMASFLYVNALLFVSMKVPDWVDGRFEGHVLYFWKATSESLHLSLLCLALPAWVVTKRLYGPYAYEPYYANLVFYPLFAAIIWFGYGCLIGWAHRTKRLLKTLLLLGGLWAVLLYLGWVRGMMYPVHGI
jgi:hypothetical protein